MKLALYLLLPLYLLFSCGNEKNPVTESDDHKFKQTALPLQLKPCQLQPPGLPDFDPESDTTFTGFVPYCRFDGNENFRARIYVAVADCALPLLVTYNMHGKKISEQVLIAGICFGEKDAACDPLVRIEKDFTIDVSDSLKIAVLDSCMNLTGDSVSKYIRIRSRINASGVIEALDTTISNMRR